jgi:hypothetical protein
MTAHCKPNVTTLLERHQAAWDRLTASWDEGPNSSAPEYAAAWLCEVHDTLWEAAPASMSEFFAKWRQIARFEAELENPSDLEPADVITQMLAELEQINGRWIEEIAPVAPCGPR